MNDLEQKRRMSELPTKNFRYHNGAKLAMDKRTTMESVTEDKEGIYGSSLTISSLEMEDAGEIKAVANNSQGEDVITAILTVDSKLQLCFLVT